MTVFKDKAIGVEIRDSGIEIATISKTGRGFSLDENIFLELPQGVVKYGRIVSRARLADALEGNLEIFGDTEVVFSLPDSIVYTHILSLSRDQINDDKKLEDLILLAVEKNIPLEKDNLTYTYKTTYEDKDIIEILVIAVDRNEAMVWFEFFREHGINIQAFDIKDLAVFSGIEVRFQDLPACFVRLEADNVEISVFTKMGVHYLYNVGVRTRSITSIENKSFKALDEEVKAVIRYFSDRTNKVIQNIFLTGDNDNINVIANLWSAKSKQKVQIGNTDLMNSEEKSTKYSAVIGSCIRALGQKSIKYDPVIPLEAIECFKNEEEKENSEYHEDLSEDVSGVQDVEQNKDDQEDTFVELFTDGSSEKVKKIKRKKRFLNKNIFLITVIIIMGIFFIWSMLQYKNIDPIEVVETETETEDGPRLNLVEVLDSSSSSSTNNMINQDQGEDLEPNDSDIEMVGEFMEKVTILDTPTGWLNVREGSSTTNPIITTVLPGKSYELLEEVSEWFKIKIPSELEGGYGVEGWVFAQYAHKDN